MAEQSEGLREKLLDQVLGAGLETAWKYGFDTGFAFVQTCCAIIGVVGVSTAAKRIIYPYSRHVEPLYNRLRTEGGQLAWPHLQLSFGRSPYWELTSKRAVILQGRTQEGKTTLLRKGIPWFRRWNTWPLSLVCWRGIYLNGAKRIGANSFQEWLALEMFGSKGTAGFEINHCLWEHRRSQWFRLAMEKLGVPFLLPMPCFIIVDQFEVLLREYPEALRWAHSLVYAHTRDNVARVIFVVKTEHGAKSLQHWSWMGTRFNVVEMAPRASADLWKLSAIDQELFSACACNIGLYMMVRESLQNKTLREEEVPDFAARTLARWDRDFSMSFPYSTHPSWLQLDLRTAKRELAAGLEVALRKFYEESDEEKIRSIMKYVVPELNGLDTLQLFEPDMNDFARMLANEHLRREGLTLAEARVVGKNLRRVMGNEVGTFGPERC